MGWNSLIEITKPNKNTQIKKHPPTLPKILAEEVSLYRTKIISLNINFDFFIIRRQMGDGDSRFLLCLNIAKVKIS